MTVEDTFLRAIVEAPDDDGVRLVYADWLEEHGQPERAEFIRLQIELAGLAEGSPRRAALQAREQALLRQHETAWVGPVLPLLLPDSALRVRDRARPKWRFRRGFIEEAALDASTWPTDAPVLFAREPIRAAWLPYTNDDDHAMLAASPYLLRLRSLDLAPGFFGEDLALLLGSPNLANVATLRLRPSEDNSHVGPEALAALAANAHLTRLRELDLGDNIEWPGDEAVAVLAGAGWLARLQRLCLYGVDLTDDGVATLAALPALSQLRELDLSGNYLGDAGALSLIQSPHLSALWVLDLRDNHGGMGEAAWAALRARFGDRLVS
jgi:uncharacterized protein (TIGR02996 family)